MIMDVLPPELIRECLLRVHYTSHHNLAAVCRSWQAMVKSPDFYEDRKKFGIAQQCICLTEMRQYRHDFDTDLLYWISVYDPLQGTWEELPRIPHFPGDHLQGIPYECHCVCVNRKLVLIGGWNPNPNNWNRLYTVFIYDFSSAKWSRGRNIPLRAITSACAASPEGLVYVAGGIEKATRRAAVYNVEKDKWKLLPHMNQPLINCFGAFIDGKFFVIGRDLNAQVYDPEKEAWSTLPNMWTVWNGESPRPSGHAVGSSDGLFYWFQTQKGVKVYDSKENVWRPLGSLPQTLGTITRSVAWRDRFFTSAYVLGTHRQRHNVFYMLRPPRLGSGAATSQDEMVGEWSAIPIKGPHLSPMEFDQFIRCVHTFEI